MWQDALLCLAGGLAPHAERAVALFLPPGLPAPAVYWPAVMPFPQIFSQVAPPFCSHISLHQNRRSSEKSRNMIPESPLESGPTTLLPVKKLLVFILGMLQKKDTYGVFSEPVDINKLPDYFEVIKQPMNFGTARKKLNSGAYKKIARSIQDVAKRDFENLRHEGVNAEDKANGSSSYNPRKTPPLNRFLSRNGANYSKWLADWNDEFPANILRAHMKYGKKQLKVDETRCDTYRQFHPLLTANNSSNSIGDMKRMVVCNPWDKFNKLAGVGLRNLRYDEYEEFSTVRE
ncbi:guanine nucleotide-binding protein subunit beta-like protein [Phtheirospermum japonicum]|uniref:Guanine nucleotide-binding protein subunit beta-like protein n=1 Tax=Phtheirospermum japonicum TaxID=374723 RepID=A0A830CW59_9LAMI|nr:guanine nucleotide-binding protein subunit beta-like protein [Phtheirospermum japonicum]